MEGGNPQYGTAFFISPTLLLTAGHVATKNERILGQAPGKLQPEISDKVFAATKLGPDVFECRTISTLYKGKGIPGSVDVSILKVKSKYHATSWVTMDTGSRVPKGSKVDLLGYPAGYSIEYLSGLLNIPIVVVEDAFPQITSIMPAHRLIVSHGTVLDENDQVVYKLSTTGGMSGGPVIYNKKAVGMHSLLQASLIAQVSIQAAEETVIINAFHCVIRR